MSLHSGSGLATRVLNLLLGLGLPVEGHVHNESSFGGSYCLGLEPDKSLGFFEFAVFI